MRTITLERLPGTYAVARLDGADAIPPWADGEGYVNISRHATELSIVCLAGRVPPHVRSDRGWACFRFVGPFAFDETGIVLSVVRPLSEAGVGVFVASTFDGDYLLLKDADVALGCEALAQAGHTIMDAAPVGDHSHA
jgi:hypothetical protein